MFKKGFFIGVLLLQVLLVSEITAADKVSETDYQLSLDEAVRIQVEANALPISSNYEADFAYLAVGDIRFVQPMLLKHIKTSIRSEPSLLSPVQHVFVAGGSFEIVGIVASEGLLSDALWYEVLYKQERYYLAVDDVLQRRQ